MSDDFEVVVIGAGMAGASIAAHLSQTMRVALVEMEDQPGYHSTGRSAAIFSESYGNGLIRDLTRASRSFFDTPPAGFTEAPLLKLRQVLHTARNQADLDAYLAITPPDEREMKTIDEARALVPIIRPEGLVGAVLSLRPSDIDVSALHQGYLRRFKANGGDLYLESPVLDVIRTGGAWTIETRRRRLRAAKVVNAAGAWAGDVGLMAEAMDIGLQPLKRTAILLDPPQGVEVDGWPMLKDASEQYYLKPDAGKLLLSPCDEEPSLPSDAQADEMTVAIAVDRIEQATTLQVRRVSHRWAGLRSFVGDRSPVVGFDPIQPDFFWLAALGGYGIQTAPALSRVAANLLKGGPIDPEFESLETTIDEMAPSRLQSTVAKHAGTHLSAPGRTSVPRAAN